MCSKQSLTPIKEVSLEANRYFLPNSEALSNVQIEMRKTIMIQQQFLP